jgi:hypothetical protein
MELYSCTEYFNCQITYQKKYFCASTKIYRYGKLGNFGGSTEYCIVYTLTDCTYYREGPPEGGIKAFQPLVEYPGFLYRGVTTRDFTKRHPTPQKRPPHRCLGCLELQFENSIRLGQSYS